MNDFLTELYYKLTEEIQPPQNDPEIKQTLKVYAEIEAQVKEKIGVDLLSQYQRASHDASHWEDIAIFTCGLRFGARFALEILS